MTKKELRIVFMGTPEFAVGTLKRLVEENYNVVAVVTQPDKPVGRHQTSLQASQVKQYAVSHDIPVLQPEKMKDPAFLEQLKAYKADLQVVVAFRMLPEEVWAMPRFGTFNVHAALLPQYRGAAPINWAVINGEKQTGVTTFFLDHDIDTGRVIMQEPFVIEDDYNVENVYEGLMKLGADVAVKTIDLIINGNGHVDSLAQDEMISTSSVLLPAPKIYKNTCEINWKKPSKKIYDFIRGLSPYPGSWTTVVDGKGKEYIMKIYSSKKTDRLSTGELGTFVSDGGAMYVNTVDCQLELSVIQLSGKHRIDACSFINGHDVNIWRIKM